MKIAGQILFLIQVEVNH